MLVKCASIETSLSPVSTGRSRKKIEHESFNELRQDEHFHNRNSILESMSSKSFILCFRIVNDGGNELLINFHSNQKKWAEILSREETQGIPYEFRVKSM